MREIPFALPHIGAEEEAAALAVLRSGRLLGGAQAEAFEGELAAYLGYKYVVLTNACTTALWIATQRNPFIPCIAVPAMSYAATANAALCMQDGSVDFCDVGEDGNVPVGAWSCRPCITVSFAGKAAGIPHNFCIEDAAHSFGAKRISSPKPVAACYSFYPTKTITTGGGGVIATDESALAEFARDMVHQGIAPGDSTTRPVVKNEPGLELRLPEVNAAIGRVQLRKVDWILERRRSICRRYAAAIRFPTIWEDGEHHASHLYVIYVQKRAEFIAHMREHGIHCGIHYSPILPQHPAYGCANIEPKAWPNAARHAATCVSLPLYPDMADDDVDRVIEAANAFVEVPR